MLSDLKIENVAVIEQAEVRFTEGLNVLTGETGAGKSILIDSINAILGNRTSRELVRTGSAKACIRATFRGLPASVQSQLEKNGYEASDEMMLYREITADGRGLCRVNGLPASASFLREISSDLLTIHGQHDSQNLTNSKKHLALLDRYAQNADLFADYHALFTQLVTVKRKTDEWNAGERIREARVAELRDSLEELDAAALTPGEEQSLRERKRVIANAHTILRGVRAAYAALSGDTEEEPGAADLLGGATDLLRESARLDSDLQPVSEQLQSLYYSARELATELAERLDAYEFDQNELEEIEARLDFLYRLERKYSVPDVAALLTLRERYAEELNQYNTSAQDRRDLENRKKALYFETKRAAQALTDSRLEAFLLMKDQMKKALAFLNMPDVQFELKHSVGPLTSTGQDRLEFLLSTNLGEEPKALAKIASGGELSRIMLAFQSTLAQRDAIETVIYDEIDAGVSGLAAGRIGQMLKKTAVGHQVLCITHTPQVAAYADKYLLIRKSSRDGRTYTDITPLEGEDRVQALAAMISGDKVSKLSYDNAREMIEKSSAPPSSLL